MFRLFRILLSLFFLSFLPLRAQDRLLTLDDLYDPEKKIDFGGSPLAGLRWLRDGAHYLQPPQGQDRSGGWLKIHAETGRAEPFFESARMEAAFAAIPGLGSEEARSLVGRGAFKFSPGETACLVEYADDLFYYRFDSARVLRLTRTPEPEEEASFSPDGKLAAFVRNQDLYVVDVEEGSERRLTADGGAKRLNGKLDWVYQEEIYGRGNFKAYWWSPDSTHIAFLQLDESGVPEFTVLDHIPVHLEREITPYPKAGDPNPRVRLGVVRPAGGATRWVDLFPYQGLDFLIVNVSWSPDGKQLVYQVQDREQTWLDLNFAPLQVKGNPGSVGTALGGRRLFRETSPAWVEVMAAPVWLKDESFLWLSERSGWKHIYHYSAEGGLLRAVTSGSWEVTELHGIDEEQGWIYFSGTRDGALSLHVYRARLDGSDLARLSEAPGRHRASFNAAVTMFLDSWSDVDTPTQVRLHGADGSLIRLLDENRVEALKQFKLSRPEFVQVQTRDGFVMEAMMIRPPDFDPAQRYPVLSYVYGGPHAPSVRDAWGGTTYMWHQFLAQRGYIVWICDNRSASGKGAQSAWPLYRNFGELELRDLEDGIEWLKSQPYADGSRVGIWGWSFGGYMTSYALTHSRSFKIGIAGAPVTDWTLYDTIYTERYMKTPQNNREGYEKSSVLRAAQNLHGKFLLIHGTQDDNVHLQNTLQLAYELQKAGRPFQLMLYPQSRHGVRDPLLVKHLRTLMTNFILENL